MDSHKEALCGGRGAQWGLAGIKAEGGAPSRHKGTDEVGLHSLISPSAPRRPHPLGTGSLHNCVYIRASSCVPGETQRPYHVKSNPSSLRGCLWSTYYIMMVLGSAQPGTVAETEKRAQFWVGGWGGDRSPQDGHSTQPRARTASWARWLLHGAAGQWSR